MNLFRLFRRAKRVPFDDMSDRELATCVRAALRFLGATDDATGIKRIAGVSGALFLIHKAHDQNADPLKIALGSVMIEDKDIGDWVVSAHRAGTDPDRDLLGEAMFVLAGTPYPDRIDEAIACFDKLTVCLVRAKELTAT